ncbi:MAG: hypothetical protein OXI05_01185 [Bacteroidota bacterium]|nr:hypothetical protein [Bacteroidota bacterium]
MTRNTSTFAERAQQIEFILRVTHDLYNRQPNTDNIFPDKYRALAVWPLIDAGYMGIEQTLKLLICLKGLQAEYTHNLWDLYKELNCSQKRTADAFYRVYHSLHKNLFSRSEGFHCLRKLPSFIKHISKGYVNWRYLPYEEKGKIPKMDVGLLLESWIALVKVLSCEMRVIAPPRRLDIRLRSYFDQEVFGAIEMSDTWLNMSQDDSGGVEFSDIHTWVQDHGGHLQAGIFLLQNLSNETWGSREKTKILHDVLRNFGKKAIEETLSGVGNFSFRDAPFPGNNFYRRDVRVLSHLLKNGDLTWDEERHKFRYKACST